MPDMGEEVKLRRLKANYNLVFGAEKTSRSRKGPAF
jgi:hypothetical protein